MKHSFLKIAVLACALTALGSSAFAEWIFAAGVSTPFTDWVYDKTDAPINETDFTANAIKFTDGGLVLKWRLDLGSARGAGMNLQAGKSFMGAFTFGAGIPVVREEKLDLLLTGVVGGVLGSPTESYSRLTTYEKENDRREKETVSEVVDFTSFIGGFRIGTDVTAIFKLSKALGVFSNLGFYFTVGSYTWGPSESKYEKYIDPESEVFSGFSFVPTLGVSLTL